MELFLLAAVVAAGFYFFGPAKSDVSADASQNGWIPVSNPASTIAGTGIKNMDAAALDALTKAAASTFGAVSVRFALRHDPNAADLGNGLPVYLVATGVVADVKIADMPDGSKQHLWKVQYQSGMSVAGYGTSNVAAPSPGAVFVLQDDNIIAV